MRDRVQLPLYGQLRDHVSYSEIKLFKECEWRWYLKHVTGLVTKDRSLPMEFGTAIHKTLEKAFVINPPGIQELSQIFWKEYAQGIIGLDMPEHELPEIDRLRSIGPEIVRDALACPDLQGIIPLRNELQLMEQISRSDGLDIKFKGFIDFVYVKQLAKKQVIYIADFKTCTWGWPAKKLMDEEVCAQLLLYKHFFCKMTGALARDVSTAFILLKKDPYPGRPRVEVAKIGAGPKALDRAIALLQDSISGMHSGAYEQNRDSCVRRWTDRVTKEERTACCPHYQTSDCPGST